MASNHNNAVVRFCMCLCVTQCDFQLGWANRNVDAPNEGFDHAFGKYPIEQPINKANILWPELGNDSMEQWPCFLTLFFFVLFVWFEIDASKGCKQHKHNINWKILPLNVSIYFLCMAKKKDFTLCVYSLVLFSRHVTQKTNNFSSSFRTLTQIFDTFLRQQWFSLEQIYIINWLTDMKKKKTKTHSKWKWRTFFLIILGIIYFI